MSPLLFVECIKRPGERKSMSSLNAEQSIYQRAAHQRAARTGAAPLAELATDLFRQFPNEDACLEFIKENRWPNGIARCGKCGLKRKHHRVNGRKAYACDRCGNHIYPLRGTVFARSSTSLQKWFYAIGLMAATEWEVSARQIQRDTGVTYKTAWRMLRLLHAAIGDRGSQSMRSMSANAVSARSSIQARHARLSAEPQEAPCSQGIDFIFNFFPAYLRMCRDV